MSSKQKPSFTRTGWGVLGFHAVAQDHILGSQAVLTTDCSTRKRGQSVPELSRNPTAGSPVCSTQRTASWLCHSPRGRLDEFGAASTEDVRYTLKEVGEAKPILFPLEGNVFPSPSSLPAIKKLNDYCGNSRGDKKTNLDATWPSTGLLSQDKWGKGFLRPRPSPTCWASKPCCTAGPRAPFSSLVPNFPSGTPTPGRGELGLSLF